jgi:hypothetical protein
MRLNSCVCDDSRLSERADVCEPPGAAEGVGCIACPGVARHGISEGPGIARGSLAGCAQPGASVEIARDPGEYQTSTLKKPALMIENIRTSKYDRCSDMLGPAGGPDYPGLRTGVHRTNAKNKLTY